MEGSPGGSKGKGRDIGKASGADAVTGRVRIGRFAVASAVSC
jgi:hypothetical protein